MKVCTKTHTVASFGTIPEGSLWADDSPYVLEENADCFAPVAKPVVESAPTKRAPSRKFGEKKAVKP